MLRQAIVALATGTALLSITASLPAGRSLPVRRGVGGPEGSRAPSLQEVTKHLQEKYPGKLQFTGGVLQFHPNAKVLELDEPVLRGRRREAGLRERDVKVVELDEPVLRKYLPRSRFYHTWLLTGQMCYPAVKTIVWAKIRGGKVTTLELLSADYTTPSEEFLQLFRGLHAESDKERERLGSAIAGLFAKSLYQGWLRNGHLDLGRYRVELWSYECHWRDIWVDFDLEGRLRSVDVRHPEFKEEERDSEPIPAKDLRALPKS
jgi:hypothetical protein